MASSRPEAPWARVLDTMRKELTGGAAPIAQRRRGAAEFVHWADTNRIPLEANPEETVANFIKTLEVHKRTDGTYTKQGEACAKMAKELFDRAAKVLTEDAEREAEEEAQRLEAEAEAEPEVTPEPVEHTEEPMPKRAQQEEQLDEELMDAAAEGDEDENDEEGEEGDEGEEVEDLEEEVEEKPRRKPRAPPVQRIQYVQQVRAPKAPAVERAASRSSALKGILPRPEKIRLYKRNEMGKREVIDDFTVDEIGDMKLEQFIREYVDQNFANGDGLDTEYIAYELDARTGKEKQPPSSIVIRGESQQQDNGRDPIDQARRAFNMMQDMQQALQPQQQAPQQKSAMLEAAQQQAAQKGDTGQMFMLMMMERMMTQQQAPQQPNGDLLLKVLDRLDRMERGGGRGGGGDRDFGPPIGGFPAPFAPPPFFAPPSPPQDHGTSKLLDLAMAKLAQPPPSLADSMKELMALQQFMSPKQNDSAEVAALRAEIRQLAAAGAGPKPGSIEDSLGTFEKLVNMSKAVNTQIGGGSDVGGFFKGLITPEVGKAIAGIVQNVQQNAGQAQQQAQQTAGIQQMQAAPAATHAAPRDPNMPPKPIPTAVSDAVKVFMLAQTPEVQTQRFVDVVMAMYLSQDPFYLRMLTPALEALNQADQSVEFLKTPRKTAFQLVAEMRPQLAKPEFVDACLAAMAVRAGADLPKTLTDTQGKWTLDYSGNVLMLETLGARAVEATPVPAVEASPAPAPVQLTEEVQQPAASPPITIDVIAPPRETVPVAVSPSA